VVAPAAGDGGLAAGSSTVTGGVAAAALIVGLTSSRVRGRVDATTVDCVVVRPSATTKDEVVQSDDSNRTNIVADDVVVVDNLSTADVRRCPPPEPRSTHTASQVGDHDIS